VHTALCDALKIDVPIIQAPIGSATSPALAAAVSNAGGLGMLAITWRSPDEIRALIRQTRTLTQRPFGVNLVLEWPMHERLAVCLDEGVSIVSFFWGDPAPYVSTVHQRGGLVVHTAGSVTEARAAAEAGVDIIVAQGWEAGGHVRGQVSTLALVPRVVDAVAPRPVVAAGGIADGRGVAAALALGAAGVCLGTRFLASAEAAVHPLYREHVVAAAECDTIYATLFDGGWPHAPHRTLRNSTVEAWERAGRPQAGQRPGEGDHVASSPRGEPILRYSDVIPLPGATGDLEALALYAGQGVGLVKDVQPAAAIVRQLVEEARLALERCVGLWPESR
jgi:nitronate monooxygenase